MSPKKLSDDEKIELVRLYRQTDETTATLAERFQVSSSTVSRVLRNSLSSEEYVNLIQRKRHKGRKSRSSSPSVQGTASETDFLQEVEQSSLTSSPDTLSSVTGEQKQIEFSFTSETSSPEASLYTEQDEGENLDQIDFSVIKAMFGEDVGDDDLEDTEEEDWDDEEDSIKSNQEFDSNEIEVLPLSQAKFPKICYLVIDRGANLITKPLKEFSDLGKIPSVETQQKTLPVFENHRGARRFSNRSQKVIKVPDGKLIPKTREHLQAKGIKRILMDGKVYMLS